MSAMTTDTHPVDRLLAEISEGRGITTAVWADDARLDATVPHWRFECAGADAVAAELSGWYNVPITVESVVRRDIPGGEAVELDLSWVEGGVPHAAHQVHPASASRTGWRASSPCSARPRNTTVPRAAAVIAHWSSSAVLPTPGSPLTTTIRAPPRDRASSASNTRSSATRPTSAAALSGTVTGCGPSRSSSS